MIGNDGTLLLYVPAGEFTMGSESGIENEKPEHRVYLDAFWIDQTEVTNGLYSKCVLDRVCSSPSSAKSYSRDIYFRNPSFDNYPVIYVSWNDAKTYCEWAGRRLPTEAEWEKAARGKNAYIYPWGNSSPNNDLLNFDFAVGDSTEVGKYPNGASLYGALDMAGNVWEWVNDWYSEAYYAISPTSNPLGPESGDVRASRGGSYDNNAEWVRSTIRNWDGPEYRYYTIGFRCARSP